MNNKSKACNGKCETKCPEAKFPNQCHIFNKQSISHQVYLDFD